MTSTPAGHRTGAAGIFAYHHRYLGRPFVVCGVRRWWERPPADIQVGWLCGEPTWSATGRYVVYWDKCASGASGTGNAIRKVDTGTGAISVVVG